MGKFGKVWESVGKCGKVFGGNVWRHSFLHVKKSRENAGCFLRNDNNDAVKSLRARVETVFGALKSTFKALSVPWQEDMDEQDNLVKIASAIHNKKLNQHVC